ncbi:hypothetical protein SCHPADRAFT_754861 [Schizopora paradoxa]|uniref:Uncharacterized protein n=1 Tax=Schizopora paradoxa TaxID=27342 RepID=A0A0H2QYG8_9AGAM|nr:hypothetical protein SCHPADRAFT_754861 [Schizopora paradoxa]
MSLSALDTHAHLFHPDKFAKVPRSQSQPAICIASQFEDLVKKVKELRFKGAGLEPFFEERRKRTKAIRDSVRPIEHWFYNASKLKERANEELKQERKENIIKRLIALGYEDEDFVTRFDPEGWKWKHLLEQTRAVSERVWENIRPELEEIIKLRRVHARRQFWEIRYREREREFVRIFIASRPRIDGLPFGKIFMRGELGEMRFFHDILHENDSRIPFTEDRWLQVFDLVPDAITKHAKDIEQYCVELINKAYAYTEEDRKAIGHPLNIDNDELQLDDATEDEDRIPTCLLFATSLITGGLDRVESYTRLLYRRSIVHFNLVTGGGSAWRFDKERCSIRYHSVTVASRLLKHLQLPEKTSMAYMMACGTDFRCLTCLRASKATSMTWFELVDHFVKADGKFNDQKRIIEKSGLKIPLLNDHDLTSEVDGKLVARIPRPTVDLMPLDFSMNRYSQLSMSLGGKELHNTDFSRAIDECDGEPEYIDLGNLDVTRMSESCPMCSKLGYLHVHYEDSLGGMRKHMRTRHGTDLKETLWPNK